MSKNRALFAIFIKVSNKLFQKFAGFGVSSSEAGDAKHRATRPVSVAYVRAEPQGLTFTFNLPYAHHISAAGSYIRIGFKNSIAFSSPSSIDISPSSCSMLIAPS